MLFRPLTWPNFEKGEFWILLFFPFIYFDVRCKMSKSCTAKNDLSNNKNPTTRDSGVFGSSRGFSEVSKFWFSRFNCSGSYLLKLVGFIGAKLGCKFRQKSHNNTIGIIWIIYIGPYIFGNFFSSLFFFWGGKLEVVVVFSYAFFFFGRHLMFEKLPKRPVLSLLGCFFSDVFHQLRRRF